mgnify:FL=1|tara:strand:+ start:669 stop:1013 length:345 start_codon:yes stop_codon:yes gene_type:complete
MMNFEEIMRAVESELAAENSYKPVNQWQNYSLKKANSNAPYHYRREGKLYIVMQDTEGVLHHKIQKLEYDTEENSNCKLTNRKSKNATNPGLQLELTASHLAYIKYNKADKSAK